MPKRTKSQVIGEIGQKIVEVQVTSSSKWIANNITPDYGIDLELQMAIEDEEVEPRFIKTQIKSHEIINDNSEFITQSLEKSFLRYTYQCRIPIILILVSTSTQKSWYIWLQKWLVESNKIPEIYDESQKKKLPIKIPTRNDFIKGLHKDLIFIARLLDPFQLYISVRELAYLPSALYDENLSEFLFDYLNKLDAKKIENDYINYLIVRFIDLGEYIGRTEEGHKVIKLLFHYVKNHGNTIKTEHITKLVLRGNRFSRQGINILGCLYDNYPEYTLTLNLVAAFKDSCPLLHYYCTIRERYINTPSPFWLSPNNNLIVGNWTLNLKSDDYLNKWANRGDSVFLYYLTEV